MCNASISMCYNALKAIYQSPVRAQAHLFHYILKRYELLDVQIRLVRKFFSCRIKIDIKA